MKYFAISGVIMSLFAMRVSAENRVACPPPRPPAGEMSCPSKLAAICEIKNGVISGKCVRAPSQNASTAEKIAFLEHALGLSFGESNSSELDEIISTGTISNRESGRQIRFRLPQ